MEKALIRVGYECNNNCLFCSVYLNKKYHGLSIEEIKRRILKAKQEGSKCIILSGGEPTIRKDILKLASFVSSEGLSFELITNGRMMEYADFTKKLKENGLTRVIVSLHANSSKTHDYLTQSSGSFDQTIKGIKNLMKCNIDTIINVVITKYNVNYLKDIINFCYNSLGIKKIKLTFPITFGRTLENYEFLSSLSKAAKQTIKAIDLAKEKGLIVYTENFPLCLLKGYESTIYEREKHGITKLIEVYDHNFKPIEECESRIKIDKCNLCIEKNKCSGLFKDYIKKYGSDEIKPILNKY